MALRKASVSGERRRTRPAGAMPGRAESRRRRDRHRAGLEGGKRKRKRRGWDEGKLRKRRAERRQRRGNSWRGCNATILDCRAGRTAGHPAGQPVRRKGRTTAGSRTPATSRKRPKQPQQGRCPIFPGVPHWKEYTRHWKSIPAHTTKVRYALRLRRVKLTIAEADLMPKLGQNIGGDLAHKK